MEVSFQQASIGSKLFHDYLDGKLSSEYFAFTPDLKGIKAAIQNRKSYPVDRDLLVNSLNSQYKDVQVISAVSDNIASLNSNNTFTVTTGHQLCIYTGPLYFIYKILSVISLSNQLKIAFPDYHFVPVYWMNSEDHDFEEINHFYMFDQKLEWHPNQSTGGPVGRMNTEGLVDIINKIHQYFPHLRGYDSIFEQLTKAYSTNQSLSSATRELVHTLFGNYGLVIIDQDDDKLKSKLSALFEGELSSKVCHRHVTQTIHQLEHSGYSAQVNPREINFFYQGHENRVRIIESDHVYTTIDGAKIWTRDEIIEEFNESSENFSTNVVTRPLYQETILPNIAYVGGPAEVHYWLQYKSMFDACNVFYPCILMRDSFLLLSNKKIEFLNKYGYSIDKFFKDKDILINEYITRIISEDLSLEKEKEVLNQQFESIRNKVLSLDVTLERTAKAEEQRMKNGLDKIQKKINKALKKKHNEQIDKINSIYSIIFPNGSFQERHDNFLTYTSDLPFFIEKLLPLTNPLNPVVKIYTEEN